MHFILFLLWCAGDVCMLWRVCRGQRATLWSPFSPLPLHEFQGLTQPVKLCGKCFFFPRRALLSLLGFTVWIMVLLQPIYLYDHGLVTYPHVNSVSTTGWKRSLFSICLTNLLWSNKRAQITALLGWRWKFKWPPRFHPLHHLIKNRNFWVTIQKSSFALERVLFSKSSGSRK